MPKAKKIVPSPATAEDTRKPPVTISEAKGAAPSVPAPISLVTSTSASSNSAPMELEGEIRRRAYELYEQRGRISGYEHEDWIVAEREVVKRYQPQQKRA